MQRFFIIPAILFLLLLPQAGNASHLYGADFYYEHVSGNIYAVKLVVYGDCDITSSSNPFSTLSTSSPRVEVSNGGTPFTTLNLSIQNPSAGIEVTPVCPAQLANTTCNSPSGTVPGVKKFTYAANVSLQPSANWRFRFDGQMGSIPAGRSQSITNIAGPPPSFNSNTVLEATLNNLTAPNSSPVYNTIPTPFFCNFKAAGFNPATVDSDQDRLQYYLVSGLNSTSNSPITYLTGYSPTAPLATTTGSFSFSNTTGQLNFTPNALQQSLVVYKVEEYRNGVLVGTSMREMTFVVLSNCNNNAPGGGITSLSKGVQINSTSLRICRNEGLFTFTVPATDLDADTINMAYYGLPAGASLNVTGNNTTAPTGLFSWDVTNVAPGAYTFFITFSDSHCTIFSRETVAFTVFVVAPSQANFSLISPATCFARAKFKVKPGDTLPPYSVSFRQGSTTVLSRTGIIDSLVDSLLPGTYTLRITNSMGCYLDTTITIDLGKSVFPAITITPATCAGGSDGSIVVHGTGALPPMTYALGTGSFSTNNILGGLAAGNHLVRIEQQGFCAGDTIINIPDPPPLHLNYSVVLPHCNAVANGSITATGMNGNPPYQYALGSGGFGSAGIFTGLDAGTYGVKLRDATNCEDSFTVNIGYQNTLNVQRTLTHITCHGKATGSAVLHATGGSAPYRYKLGNGSYTSTNSFTGLPAGTYNLRVEDDNSCFYETSFSLTEPSPLTANVAVTDISCFGANDGSATIAGVGGVLPRQYAIGTGSFGSVQMFTGLPKGNHTLYVKDANNCIIDKVISIAEPAELQITGVSVTEPECHGTATGSLQLSGTGGTSPYTFALSSGGYGSSGQFSGVAAGSHVLRLKDDHGCMKDTTLLLSEPPLLTLTANKQNSVCASLSNGKVTLSASGGIPGYSYARGSGSFGSSPVFSSLAAGSYVFHVRDANDCTENIAVTIADSLVVNGSVTVTNASCFGQANGVINISASGGTVPYTYYSPSGSLSSGHIFGGLNAGVYNVGIKDANNCMKQMNVTVTEPLRLELSASITPPICYDSRDGAVALTAAGGTGPYTFALGQGVFSTNNQINNLGRGNHTIVVKDSKGCTKDTTIMVTSPPELKVALDITNVLCFGEALGKVAVHASGGTPGYMYSFDNNLPQGNNVLDGIGGGTRAIHVSDAKGCKKDTLIVLSIPPPLSLTAVSFVHPRCSGVADGSVSLGANGGVPPYSYGYANGPLLATGGISGLKEGDYIFFIEDQNGCLVDTPISLRSRSNLLMSNIEMSNASCYNLADGSIVVEAMGGIAPLTYNLNGRQSPGGNFTEGLKAGFYTVSIRDSLDCAVDTTIQITSPPQLKLKADVRRHNDCESVTPGGSILAEVSGGAEPYTYFWRADPQHNLPEISGLQNGTYVITVSDTNNCSVSDSATVDYEQCCHLVIPDAFTPNNDGLNDLAKPLLTKGVLILKHFSIFNRFGQRVFTTSTLGEGWDGIFNGEPQDLGTYNYYMQGICGSETGRPVEFKGTITLVR